MRSGPKEFRDWMRRRGFTQADASRYLEYTEALVSKILAGTHNLGLRNAIHVERLTGIPVEVWASELDDESESVVAGNGKRKVAKE